MDARSDLAKRLGTKVAQLRRELKFGQKELAYEIGVRPKVISQLERGISVPRIERLAEIATALHVTLPDLFSFVEEVSDRRGRARERIDNMLRGRRAADIVAVRDILKLVFAIKRRERPALTPPPGKRQSATVKKRAARRAPAASR